MKIIGFIKSEIRKFSFKFTACITMFAFIVLTSVISASAQAVLFDFDNIAIYTPFPTSVTVSGITAHLAGTGQSYSIQDANVLGFTPQGFSGHSIYPNSINLADLLIGFDQTLTHFSIMYSPQELGCDTSATMRVTAYMNGIYVGTDTKIASNPGTWPTDTLSCSFPLGFDSVVVHYESIPWPCQDYGVIFMADNMRVTQFNTGTSNPEIFIDKINIANPVSQAANISFSLLQSQNINITIYDITGKLVKHLFNNHLNSGAQRIDIDLSDDAIVGGVYFLNISGEYFSQSYKLIIIK